MAKQEQVSVTPATYSLKFSNAKTVATCQRLVPELVLQLLVVLVSHLDIIKPEARLSHKI